MTATAIKVHIASLAVTVLDRLTFLALVPPFAGQPPFSFGRAQAHTPSQPAKTVAPPLIFPVAGEKCER